jgi:hypothetical protein
MARTGRPSKFKGFSDTFIKYIENGLPVSSAAALSGLAPSTAMDWLAKGRAGENKEFADFSERYTRASDRFSQSRRYPDSRRAGGLARDRLVG